MVYFNCKFEKMYYKTQVDYMSMRMTTTVWLGKIYTLNLHKTRGYKYNIYVIYLLFQFRTENTSLIYVMRQMIGKYQTAVACFINFEKTNILW